MITTQVLSLSILLVQVGVVLWKWGKERYSEHQPRRSARAGLRALSTEEKELLRGYLDAKTKTRYLPVASGVVAGLVHAKIIYQASPLGRPGGDFKFAFNVQPWAWDYLSEHPEVLAPVQPSQGE